MYICVEEIIDIITISSSNSLPLKHRGTLRYHPSIHRVRSNQHSSRNRIAVARPTLSQRFRRCVRRFSCYPAVRNRTVEASSFQRLGAHDSCGAAFSLFQLLFSLYLLLYTARFLFRTLSRTLSESIFSWHALRW